MKLMQYCFGCLVAIICTSNAIAQTVYLNPGEKKEHPAFHLDPDGSVSVTVTINDSDQWKLLSSSDSSPWGDKPGYFLWTGGGSGKTYGYKVANTHWIEAWARVRVDATWVRVGEGGGEGEMQLLHGYVIIKADSRAGSFQVMAETNVIIVGSTVQLQAYLEKSGGDQKAAVSDWEVKENGIIVGSSQGSTATVKGTNSGGMTVKATFVIDSNMSDEAEITVVAVTSIEADPDIVCVGGDVNYTITTHPSGYGYKVQYTPADTSEPGIHEVVATCGTSSATTTVTILSVESKSVTFTSDHGVMTDYNTNFAGSGGTVYNPRGWVKGGANNPISHTKGGAISVNVVVCGQPSGLSCTLEGDGPINPLDFAQGGFTSTGSDQTIPKTAGTALDSKVDVLDHTIAWTATISSGGVTCDSQENSGSHKIYVTWGTPAGGGYTEKRISWVCNEADGSTTQEGCADELHDAVAANTTFGSGGTDGWALLDGGTGDCDNQARCMKYTVEMLGEGPASVKLVRASTNAGAGNCLNLESRVVSNQTHYLIMDFDTGAGYNWNAYEDCCETAGSYYAVTPKEKEDNDYKMLQAIGCQQYWVRTNVTPGSPGWTVLEVFEEVAIP